MRFINEIFTITIGRKLDNATLLATYERYIDALALDSKAREELRDFVHFCLVGDRTRYMYASDFDAVNNFASRAGFFQSGAEEALGRLAAQILPSVESAGISFDAVLTTTSTGNLMPGLSYRVARKLKGLVRSDTMMLDLGNVGCTGGCKALNLARSLDDSFRNILIVSVEVPSSMMDITSIRPDVWLASSTFGDGAAAMWISSRRDAGTTALALEQMHYWHCADVGLDLIRWNYHNYYAFAMQDEKSFNIQVRNHVCQALAACSGNWNGERTWAIHPAGISQLMRISRGLGITSEALAASVDHYRRFSNMSSASVLHILKEVAAEAPVGSPIHLLTMGAGFNVIYGRLRKEV